MLEDRQLSAHGPHGFPMSWEESVQWLKSQPGMEELIVASYYDDPLIAAAMRYQRSDEWKAITELLPKGAGRRALDVGAGRGIASFALAAEGFEVSALEPDNSTSVGAEAVRTLAREHDLNIEVVQGKSERLPFADEEFDLVFGRAVMHHMADMSAACREFFRVLKHGGVFIAVREHVLSKATDLDRFLKSHPLHALYGGENAFLLRQYVAAIQNAGLTLDRILSPLRSPINLAPHSRQTFLNQLAKKAASGSCRLEGALRVALNVPGMWSCVRILAECVDNRPGRLYSFVAHRV